MRTKSLLNHLLQASKYSIALTQVLSVGIMVNVLLTYPITIEHLIMMILGYICLAWIGISMFNHRYLSHASFTTHKVFRYIGITLGALAGRGDPLAWSYVHRLHHMYADTIKDPHSSNHYTFMQIANPLAMNYADKIDFKIIRDLLRDKYLVFLSKYYNIMIFGMFMLCLFVPVMTYIWLIPMALTHIALILFVYYSHRVGYRNFDIPDNSRNNWLISAIFGGEGWENNHHNDERNPSFKVKPYEFDPVGALINTIRK
jgi:fatty-acid desaturase